MRLKGCDAATCSSPIPSMFGMRTAQNPSLELNFSGLNSVQKYLGSNDARENGRGLDVWIYGSDALTGVSLRHRVREGLICRCFIVGGC